MNLPIIIASEGFGLNLNLFETNILNLAVVIFGLYKFLPNFLGSMLERRRSAILADLKDAELTTERLNLAALAEPYVGKYYSQDYVRRKILRQTDEEIIEQDKIIDKEIADGTIEDPVVAGLEAQIMGDPGNGANAIQNTSVPKDPDPVRLAPDKLPRGGEI